METITRRASDSLHAAVRKEISRRIEEGVYTVEEPIPSASALSSEFGVSTITIERALRDLQAAGALVAIPGKGTYVKKTKRFVRRLDISFSRTENQGIHLHSITREKIRDATLRSFDPPDRLMLCVRKTLLADGLPLVYDAVYLSSDVNDELLKLFENQLVTEVLAHHGIRIRNTRIIVDAAPAAGPVEDVFGVPAGYPMVRRCYRHTTTDPNITIFGYNQAPFDQLAWSVDFAQSE
ncbi:GntR family transcriptional regulator [Paraburkholderia phenoliruptrix]|uniref:GntR family transcriptional regulator n=1 Tax=Paraburkholderia phenoliruptrix TaxID=252970 RepID=UPI001EE6E079|nr:GntR family transcriptional regulator [Paraburkholderia phenoliruptrix]